VLVTSGLSIDSGNEEPNIRNDQSAWWPPSETSTSAVSSSSRQATPPHAQNPLQSTTETMSTNWVPFTTPRTSLRNIEMTMYRFSNLIGDKQQDSKADED
jgi:hypothetical protein